MATKSIQFDELLNKTSSIQQAKSTLAFNVLLECVLIVLRLLCNYLFVLKPLPCNVYNNTKRLKHGITSNEDVDGDQIDASMKTAIDEVDLIVEDEDQPATNRSSNETPPKRHKKSHSTTTFHSASQSTPYQSSFLAKLNQIPSLKVHRFRQMIESNAETFVRLMLKIQALAALNHSTVTFYNNNSHMPGTSIELLFNSMQMLSSYLFSSSVDESHAKKSVFSEEKVVALRQNWLKCLMLVEHYRSLSGTSSSGEGSSGAGVDINATFRREACAWLYRMCSLDDTEEDSEVIVVDNVRQPLVGVRRIILDEMFSLLNLAVNSKPVSFFFIFIEIKLL